MIQELIDLRWLSLYLTDCFIFGLTLTDSVAVGQIHFKMTQHSVASCLTDSIIK